MYKVDLMAKTFSTSQRLGDAEIAWQMIQRKQDSYKCWGLPDAASIEIYYALVIAT